jgi:hypothetical protein
MMLLPGIVGVAAMGCHLWQGGDEPNEEGKVPNAALAVSTEVAAESDVARIRVAVEGCDGSGRQEIEAEVHEMSLPGGFKDTGVPVTEGSSHRFSDAFLVLPAGCYNLEAQPLDAEGKSSASCFAAHAKDIKVVDGKTTEVWLVSQCDGPATGALDTTTITNTPPTIKSLNYNPSKFILAGSSVMLSVAAEDADNDPLDFEWTQVSGPSCNLQLIRAEDDNESEQRDAVKISPTMAGKYEFQVNVYDLMRDKDGKLIRFERYLEQQGDAHLSRDSLVIPLYVAHE